MMQGSGDAWQMRLAWCIIFALPLSLSVKAGSEHLSDSFWPDLGLHRGTVIGKKTLPKDKRRLIDPFWVSLGAIWPITALQISFALYFIFIFTKQLASSFDFVDKYGKSIISGKMANDVEVKAMFKKSKQKQTNNTLKNNLIRPWEKNDTIQKSHNHTPLNTHSAQMCGKRMQFLNATIRR